MGEREFAGYCPGSISMKDFLIGVLCDHLIGTTTYKQSVCPKCLGSAYTPSFANDLIVKNAPIPIEGESILRQQIYKILTTPKGFYADEIDYGSDLFDLIGKKQTLLIQSKIRGGVLDALEYLKLYDTTDTPLNERISAIDSFQIYYNENDPGHFIINFNVITEAGTKFNMSPGVPI